jgi:SsrA-binding protein
MSKKKKPAADNLIASNRKALHDYHTEERFEAGIMLEGWEVKSLRAARVQLKESYVVLKRGEAFIIGMHISPLTSASTHVTPDPVRTRKLLLHKKELSKLFMAVEREGYTIVCLDLHWKKQRAKATIAIAKGKKKHDKRETLKRRDWEREKQRLLKR